MPAADPTRIDLDALIALRQQAHVLDLSSRPRVMTDLAGAHASGFCGRGMEFDDYRVYQPGDDLRAMDWRVTARTGTPHIRLYHEERERPVILCVDLRPAMWFATRGRFKAVCAAEAAARSAARRRAAGQWSHRAPPGVARRFAGSWRRRPSHRPS